MKNNYTMKCGHIAGRRNIPHIISYVLELLQMASDLFERSQPAQKNQLLRFVLANAKVEGKKLVWDLKSPFSDIAQCVKTKEWLPTLEELRTGAAIV